MFMSVRLHQLPPRTSARIFAIDGAQADVAHRLREMGFDEGVEVEMLHRGPIGADPVAVRVGGSTVCLRRAHARCVALAALPLAAE